MYTCTPTYIIIIVLLYTGKIRTAGSGTGRQAACTSHVAYYSVLLAVKKKRMSGAILTSSHDEPAPRRMIISIFCIVRALVPIALKICWQLLLLIIVAGRIIGPSRFADWT
jgi:hypothetical protein